MSLLCNRETLIVSKIALNSKGKGGHDIIHLGRNLWNSLAREINSSRLCLCLEPLLKFAQHLHNPICNIICWAELDEETDHITVPPLWPITYKDIFGHNDSTMQITVHEPIPLQEVFITALSLDAYDLAKDSRSSLEIWFSANKRILRCGTIYQLDPIELQESKSLAEPLLYRLEMSMPVLQGYARPGLTNFVITTTGAEKSRLLPTGTLEDDYDDFEINEGFLRSSIPQLSNLPVKEHSLPVTNSPIFPRQFIAKPWPSHFNESGDDMSFYVCTLDLIGLGVLTGDWLLASSPNNPKQRLVRIQAEDRIVDRTGIIVGSPVLLHNVCFGQVDGDNLPSTSNWIILHPFHLREPGPVIPTARSVTVARIASPTTVNKTYQHLFIRSLKEYFERWTRFFQPRDVIAVCLDTDEESFVEQMCNKISGSNGCYDFPTTRPRMNEMAFFRITDIDSEARYPDANDIAEEDHYSRCKTGELGCRVDPNITTVIQKGIEHSRVPHLTKVFHNPFPTSSQSILLRRDSVYGKLMELVRAALIRNAMNYNLSLSILLEGPRGVGKYTVARETAQCLGMHLMELNCFEIMGESDIRTESILKYRFEQASSCAPCLLILRHIEAFANLAEDTERKDDSKWSTILGECLEGTSRNWKVVGQPIVVIATTTESGKVPTSILSCFRHKFNCNAPNEQERQEILDRLLTNTIISPDVSVEDIATQTAALLPSDLVDLLVHAKLSSLERGIPASVSEVVAASAGIPLTSIDFDRALTKSRLSYSENIGAPKIPKVSWNDVGGLASVKADILDTIQLPLQHPELFTNGLKKRSGILLYGPPGTGKTLIAKAVATSFSLNFISVKGPELLNMYIGESEANVRRVFQRARDATPCVVFFDELDSIAPKRGNHGDSGGVMDRIVSQLLAELDGMASTEGDVFVIGATNRPDLLDPALLRPGRFDKLLYLGISETHEAQVHILRALTRKFHLDPTLHLHRLAEKCPFNYTGADFYALCSDAMLISMSRKAMEVEKIINELNAQEQPSKHPNPITPQYYLAEMAKPEDLLVIVKETDFELALKNLVPSLSQYELEHYKEVKRRFSVVFE
ncbi:hypothetical protein AX15_006117 [Amanita polypyramis BW_CC]|nr:hypothetical protein AX15_006117 [Amanita polypyramis BW_CC]